MLPSVPKVSCLGLQALPLVGLLVLAALFAAPPQADARQGDARAGLFVGTTTFGIESQTTSGATFGLNYGYEFLDDVLWTAAVAYSATEGVATVDDGAGGAQATVLDARSTQYSTGLLAYVTRRGGAGVAVFLGGGLSVLDYELNFPGTTVGTVSGTGPGLFLLGGLEIGISRNVTFIPQINVQVHTVDTESGTRTGLVSGGLVLSLRISG